MYTVLLSGGSGKRLWPLSNEKRSKQYVRLTSSAKTGENCSMVQRVWEQLGMCHLQESAVITAERSQNEILRNQLGQSVRIITEPARRNTFPAIAISCAYLASEMGAELDSVVVVVSVDTFADTEYFESIKKLSDNLSLSDAAIGLMGAFPTYPSEKYGYILCSDGQKTDCGLIPVTGFVEKPDAETAKKLMDNGALWNCGVFCFRIKEIIPYLKQYGLSLGYRDVFENFDRLPSVSFDYMVLEKTALLSVLKYEGFWKDIGTWNTLTEQMALQTVGDVYLDDSCKDTHVINELDMPVIVMGIEDAVVAASYDGILVTGKQYSSYIKKHVDMLQKPAMYEERSWGYIKVLDSSVCGQIRTITGKILILEGMETDYFAHDAMSITITVLRGDGQIIMGNEARALDTGETVQLRAGVGHVIKAVSEMEYIEIRIRND